MRVILAEHAGFCFGVKRAVDGARALAAEKGTVYTLGELIHNKAVVEKLKELEIDLVVLAGCMVIFTEELVNAYPNAIMNVHPALIPSFCGEGYYGLKVHEQALRYGVKLSGATVHFVSAECDGGPIIAQKAVAVLADDTPEILQRRIMEQAEWILLPNAVRLFCEDKIVVDGRKVIIKEEI